MSDNITVTSIASADAASLVAAAVALLLLNCRLVTKAGKACYTADKYAALMADTTLRADSWTHCSQSCQHTRRLVIT